MYVIDVPFPSNFDASDKRWRFEDGEIGWDRVLVRWKARGPMNHEYVSALQRGWSVGT
jgi:ring-1,2-phenylacetyl-CoA epoxidase subunit PaaA